MLVIYSQIVVNIHNYKYSQNQEVTELISEYITYHSLNMAKKMKEISII